MFYVIDAFVIVIYWICILVYIVSNYTYYYVIEYIYYFMLLNLIVNPFSIKSGNAVYMSYWEIKSSGNEEKIVN